MNIEQQITWTVLPNGVDSKRNAHLSIFVSPRLMTDENLPRPELKQFDDFLAWPKRLVGLGFRLRMNTGWSVELKPDLSALDPDLWSELFPHDTFVRPYQFPDYSQRVLHTFPVRNVAAYLKNAYQTIGVETPGELPGLLTSSHPSQTLWELSQQIGPVLERRQRSEKRGTVLPDPFEYLLHELKVLVPGKRYAAFSSQAEQDFYQVNRFYSRPEDDTELHLEKPDPSLVPKPPEVPDLDFHQALSALGDQPAVLRALGIILEVQLPVKQLLDNGGGTLIWAEPLEGEQPFAPYNQHLTPRTAFLLDKKIFQPKPHPGSPLAGGFLNLAGVDDNLDNAGAPFHLIEVDPDGMAIKALDFAGTLRRVTRHEGMDVGTDIPPEMGLPALQSGGLALVQNARAYALFQHFQADQPNNTQLLANNLVLHADDLLRGYRVDIFDDLSGKWFSLMARVGKVIFPASAKEIPLADEGYVKAASTTSQDDQDSDLYFHEAMFKWNGWSLAAPRPGKVIVRVEEPLGSGQFVEKVLAPSQLPEVRPASLPFPMETELKAAPGTLPRLRFGSTYRLRARTADLAGNSLPAEIDTHLPATEKVRYGRYEPIAPPAVVPRELPAEGESLERLVIRSNYKISAKDYAQDPQVAAITAAKPYLKYRAANERHIVAPKTAQLMAEQHGMFDPFFAPGQTETGYRIALKEYGSLLDDQIWNPALNAYDPILPPGSVELVKMPDPPHEVQYALHHEHPLRLPYLPDPLARGAAFRFLPDLTDGGTPGLDVVQLPDKSLVLKVPFDMKWPDSMPFLIRLEEKAGEMPPGSPLEACSEKFPADPLPPLWDAEQRILTVYLPKGEQVKVRYSTFPDKDENGRPDLELLGVWQWLLEHPAADPGLLERYALNGAHWMISPYRTLSLVHAVQQPLCEPVIDTLGWMRSEGQTFVTLGGKFILNAKSTGKLDLQAEWQEPVDDLTESKYKIVSGKAHAFELRIDYDFPNQLPDKAWENDHHEFGDTRHRYVSYHLEATTRYREYFPPEITSDPKNIQRIGPLKSIHVPSSARPAALKPLYILPTYRWSDDLPDDPEAKWEQSTRTRWGNSLRVYMERPWFLTGDDEKLGVVLWPDPAGGFENAQKYVSLMGQDPIHSSNLPLAVLRQQHFPNRSTFSRDNLLLRELPGTNVNVAAFDVQYNEERGLWYADLFFDTQMSTSYYPFVRLALARYQPYSVQDVEISPVVLADFIQLAPDRHLTIQFHGEQLFSFTVRGYGPGERTSNYVTATLQTRDPGIPAELGWVDALNSGPIYGTPTNVANYWSFKGRLMLPAARGSQPMRVLVQEFETYVIDREYYYAANLPPKGSRVVYADTVEI
jgi:hypothetical protein